MLTPLKYRDAEKEEGFTLIELLVVVIIIGILAAIAIPVFLNQRTKARESAVESTLRSSATYMEIVYTEGNTYPTTLQPLIDQGFRDGDKVTTSPPTVAAGGASYCVDAVHVDDAAVFGRFNSLNGSPELYASCA
jgi:type IV pilus assembly protein PilA